jgi:hypothetical protein
MKPNGSLEVDAGLRLDVDDLAEAQHDRLLALVDDEDRRIEQERTDGDDDADEREDGYSSVVSSRPARFCSSGSGR